MDLSTLKQLGLQTMNQLAGQIQSYCQNAMDSSTRFGQALISLLGDEIDYYNNTFIFPVSIKVTETAMESIDAAFLKEAQLKDSEASLLDDLTSSLSDSSGNVFILTRLANGNIIDEQSNLLLNRETEYLANVIQNDNGVTSSLDKVAKDILNNAQIYDGISHIVSCALEGVDSSFQTVQDYLTREYRIINDETQNIIDNARQLFATGGLSGLIMYLKQWFSCLNTIHATEENTLGFTDNSEFVTQFNLAGVIGGVALSAIQVAAAVITAVAPIVGMVITGLTAVATSLLNFAATAVDANAYGTIRWQSTGTYGYPQGLIQQTFSVTVLTTDNAYLDLYNTLMDHGSLVFYIPGGELYMWLISDAIFGMEIHVTPFATRMGTLSSYAFQIDQYSFKVLCPPSSEVWREYCYYCDNGLSNLKRKQWSLSDLDAELRVRYFINYSYIMMWLLSSCYVSPAVETYLVADTNATHGFRMWAEIMKGDSWANIENWVQWSEINSVTNMQEKICGVLLDPETISVSTATSLKYQFYRSGTAIDKYIWSIARSFFDNSSQGVIYGLQGYLDVSPVSKFGDWYVYEPGIAIQSVLAGLIVTGIAIAAVAVTTAVVKKRITKAIHAKRSSLAVNIEKSWEDYKTNPSYENFTAYYNSVRKNNLWTKFIGGTKYSLDGMWGSTPDGGDPIISQPATIQKLNSITESQTSDSEKLDTIINLICGSVNRSR